jgi:NADH-quinone oxidoreductase subunit F
MAMSAHHDARGGTGPVLLAGAPVADLEDYLARGGGTGLAHALAFGPDGTIEEVLAAGLRGRGGAGFPTGKKWSSVRHGGAGTRYVVVNAAEGEPATFKDRALIRHDPYRVVEGAAIAAFAVGAGTVHLATKRSYQAEAQRLLQAAVDLTGSGLLQDLAVTVVEGPDDYLFGEEKALLEVVEGRAPLPRLLPPYEFGLHATELATGWENRSAAAGAPPVANPTVVNNAETLAAAAHILARGAEWFRTFGTPDSPGTIIVTVVGDVVTPGVHEVPMGTPLADVLDACGGARPGRQFKAAFSGVSNAVLPAADFDVPLTHEDFAARGSGLGAAGFAIYDDSVNMVTVAHELSRFLAVESCGQCPPCKTGSATITALLGELCRGEGSDATLAQLEAQLRWVTSANRCYLGTEEQVVVSSVLRRFPEDVVALLEHRPTPLRQVQVPLVRDLVDGDLVMDTHHADRHAS